MNVVVNGLMTKYQKSGNAKKVLVFLHGWGDSLETSQILQEYLKDDYTILTVDMPGFGASQTPKTAMGLEKYAVFIKDWLEKISIKKVDLLIGHSFGGAVAITAVARGEVKPDNLVLISSSGIRNPSSLSKKAYKVGASIGKIPLYLLPADKATSIKKRLYGKAGSDIMLIPQMRETYKLIIRQDVRLMASKINVPTLIIYGTKDQHTPPQYGAVLHDSINKSRLEIIDGGHFIHQEKAADIAKLILDFVGQDK